VSEGASGVVGACAAILANLIAFAAFFAFADSAVTWFFSLVNLHNFGLTGIFQFLFWPLAFVMGVGVQDCRQVSNLIGIKTFVNEFVAYAHMGQMIDLRNELIANGTFQAYQNGSLSLRPNQNILWNVRIFEKRLHISTIYKLFEFNKGAFNCDCYVTIDFCKSDFLA
jgi:hypothetical protein